VSRRVPLDVRLARDSLVPAELELADWQVVDEMYRDPSGRKLLDSLWAHRAAASRAQTSFDYLAGGAVNLR